jgi:phosphoglycerate dehydrogenase-like enzyme
MSGPVIAVIADPEMEEAVMDAVRAGGGRIAPVDEATALIWASSDPPATLLPHLTPAIEWVQLWDAGVEAWFRAGVIDEARVWTAAKGVYAKPIAEYVLATMLAAARQLPHVVAARTWQQFDVGLIAGTTVGILGAGDVGSALIRALSPFGVHILAMTRSGLDVAVAVESFAPDAVDQILRRSDYVICALPETPETIGLLSGARLQAMRSSAWLINVGRGSVVDTDALTSALAAGQIAGAVLDVTDPEPLPDKHPLWSAQNVLITSHTACTALLGRTSLCDRVRDNVARFRCRTRLVGQIDVRLRY